MPSCCYRKCLSSDRNKQATGVTFHVIPKEPRLHEKWLKVIKEQRREEDWIATKWTVVCSLHFKKDDFYLTATGRHKLQIAAVPVCATQYPENDEPSTSKARVSKKAAAYYEDSAAVLLMESDDDDNVASEQETAVHYTSSKESQKGTMRLSAGLLFPETPAYSLTQELVMDLHELSDKIQNFYPATLGKQFTLTFQGRDGDKSEYIFTSASETRRSGEHHSSVCCNECGSDIVGFRYKCMSCADYDLCSACESLGLHAEHLMMRIAKPIKMKRARTLLQQWCEAMKGAGISSAEEITRSRGDQPDPDPEPQQQALSCSRSLLLEPPPLAPLSSSTGTAKGKATTKAKAKAMKKSTSDKQSKKSAVKKRKMESPERDNTMEIEIKLEPLEDFCNPLTETEVMLPTEELKSEYADPLGLDKIKTEDVETDPTPSSTLIGKPVPAASTREDPGPAVSTSKDARPTATTSEDPHHLVSDLYT